ERRPQLAHAERAALRRDQTRRQQRQQPHTPPTMRVVRQVVLIAALAACFVSTLPQAEAASWTDRIFSGFLSFGRAFSNATQVVVARVKVLVNPSGSNKKQDVKDIDIFASVCS
ncbi:hypothetical protein HPB47_002832, partial [Ixodes persulcatus]